MGYYRDKTKEQLADELESLNQELVEIKTAMKVLLSHQESYRKDLEDRVQANLKEMILPYLERIRRTDLDESAGLLVELLRSNIESIVSDNLLRFSSYKASLTPKEWRIAELIRDGKKDREIVEIFDLSIDTVKTHRRNIRKKLGINGTKSNLRTHLFSYLNS